MGKIQPLIVTIVLLASLLYSKYLLDKAGLLLQEKERQMANRQLTGSVFMNAILSLVYFVSMLFAGMKQGGNNGWAAVLISATFTTLYILLNHRIFRQFGDWGFPDSFGHQFVQSRVILLVGLLIFAHFLFNAAKTFAIS